jgi:GAF domain-containing protein
MSREAELSRTFVQLADTLVQDFDVVDFLHGLAVHCVELVDVEAAGLLLADPTGRLRVVGSSSEKVRLLELFEVQNSAGPCLDCYESGDLVAEDDLEQASRWPAFQEEAVAAGFRSVQAVPLRLRTEVIGALNLFRSQAGALTSDDLLICRALADVATIGLLQERAVSHALVLAQQLQSALNTRVVIEQAKGMLAEQAHVDTGQAFELLRRYARERNLLLAEVASDVLDARLTSAEFVSDRV